MPTLEDDGFVLWEANAILFCLASKRPVCGLWPADLRGQECALGMTHKQEVLVRYYD
jgi:glutathione S-transferase